MRQNSLFTSLAAGLLAVVTLALIAAIPGPAAAVTAEEMLADPALESRARNLSKQLRCLVCQNQSIDDSDADLARDLRIEVRKQLTTGASDAEILERLRLTYGDYVLLNPPVSPATYALWAAPVIILLLGGALVLAGRRRDEAEAAGEDQVKETEGAESAPSLADATRAQAHQTSVSRLPAMAVFSLAIAVSLGIYLMLGRADLADAPLSGRGAELAAAASEKQEQNVELEAELAAARDAAAKAPNEVGSWLRLALAAARTGNSATELAALEQAETLTNRDPAIIAMRAEALSRAANGQVTIPARRLVEDALSRNPEEPRALYLRGLAAYQDENFADAVAVWQRLQQVSSANAPWMGLLAENIADAAQAGGIVLQPDSNQPDLKQSGSNQPGPNAADIAAAAEMTAEDRNEMIRSMVDGLADKLAADPSDRAGWQRLVRAYQVLEDFPAAQTALVGAADADPTNADAQLMALEHMVVHRLDTPFLEDATRLLARLDSIAPNRAETLYVRGHFAKLNGDVETARDAWQTLMDRLPADAPILDQLQAAIDSL